MMKSKNFSPEKQNYCKDQKNKKHCSCEFDALQKSSLGEDDGSMGYKLKKSVYIEAECGKYK